MPLFPSWSTLLTRVVNELGALEKLSQEDHEFLLDELAKGNDYPDIANYCIDLLGTAAYRQLLEDFFSKEFDYEEIPPAYQQLLKLPQRAILTTNYDEIPERGGQGKWSCYTNQNVSEGLRAISKGEKVVLKIHGDIKHQESIVLTKADYDKIQYSSPAIRSALESIFTNYTICFVGFSLNDPHLNLLTSYLNTIHNGLVNNHFAFMTSKNEIKHKLKEKSFNINIIPYEPSEDAHPEVYDFLAALSPQEKPAVTEVVTPAQASKTQKEYLLFMKRGHDITVADILDNRRHTYNEFYYKRKIDQDIYASLQSGKSMVLVGNSLSGKTRAVYELFKRDEFQYDLIFSPKLVEDFRKFPSLHEFLPSRRPEERVVVFLDDINTFYTKKNFDEFVKELLRNDIIVVATCMTGPEYQLFLERSENKVQELLTTYEIPKIDKAIISSLDQLAIDIEKENFDGNIGSLFLGLTVMKNRYNYLWSNKSDPTIQLALTILDILKAFYYASNFEQKSAYKIEKVKDYYYRKKGRLSSRSFTNQLQKQIYENLLTQEMEQLEFNWQNAVDLLKSTYTDLNFIEEQQDLLKIEDAYFEKNVVARYYKIRNISSDIFRLYPDETTRKEFGFYVKTGVFNVLIAKARDYQESLSILEKMYQERIHPNAATFTSLINKAPDYEHASALLAEMQEKGVPPNTITYTSLINAAPTFKQAQALLTEMQEKGIAPNEVTFTSLINKAPDFELSQSVYSEMIAKGIPPNEFTFTSLIKKAPDYAHARALLTEMQEKGVPPNTITYTSLINTAPSLKQAQAVLTEMQEKGIAPNEVTFNSLVNKAPDFESARALLSEMLAKGISPDEFTFNSLVNKAPDFDRARALLSEMLAKGISPDEVTFNSLVNKAPDFDRARALLDEMLAKGVPPDQFTFNSLIHKATDFESAKALLREMFAKGVLPDEITFSSLIPKTPDFESACTVFFEMVAKGIHPPKYTYNTLARHINAEPAKALAVFWKSYQEDFYNDATNRMLFLFFDHFDYLAFIRKHLPQITATNDSVVKSFAHELERRHTPESHALALELIEKVKDKDQEYCNLVGNLHRKINPGEAIQFYRQAVNLEPSRKKQAKYFHNMASTIYESKLLSQFSEAIRYCEEALACNPNFHYSKELLLYLHTYESPLEELLDSLVNLTQSIQLNKRKAFLKIIEETANVESMQAKRSLLQTEVESD
jgi:hypothetical protein